MKTIISRIHATKLMADGYENNPNCWIGSGYLFCAGCNAYHFHYVLSKEHDHRTVCNVCHTSEDRRYESDKKAK